MKYRTIAFSAMLGSVIALPSAAFAVPTCAQLGTNPAYGLFGNNQISGLTATLYPAGADIVPNPFGGPPSSNAKAYCRVDFTLSTESGPSAGYRPGQQEQIKIRVGLPANSVDGGSGGVQGFWNGKNRDLGGGGYVGGISDVLSSVNLNYVGTNTDTGHTGNPPFFPILDGSWALNPDGTLNQGLIQDFARDGIHDQHIWGIKLAKTYYGTKPTRKYWMGCSTGGRQGHYQAQNFPNDFDGILAGAPAFNWDRFITAELWPAVVMNQEIPGGQISPTKLAAVSQAALAACDGIDGITDGIVEDPRKCTYNAANYVCGPGNPDTTNCLTPAEAAAVNKIWEGPKDASGKQAWYGLERGAGLFGGFNLAGPGPFEISRQHYVYWIHQNPAFDWHTVTEASFFNDMLTSISKFNDVIGTDDDLKEFRESGGKMITYHGLTDTVIFPRGTYHYYNSVLQGNYKETQKFYRFFPYPNNGHCGGDTGPQIDQEALFSALVNWVENGTEPDYIVASQASPARTRKICMYPNVQVYNGSGSTDDQANFHCETRKKDDQQESLEIARKYETSTKAASSRHDDDGHGHDD